MNRVFEKFATRLVSDALVNTPLTLSAQHGMVATIIDERRRRSYTTIRPDLVISDPSTGQCIPVDVKYKRYDLKNVSTGDIYQSFLYSYALEDKPDRRRSGILYASTAASTGPSLSIRSPSGKNGGRLVAAGLDIPGRTGCARRDKPREAVCRGAETINGTDRTSDRVSLKEPSSTGSTSLSFALRCSQLLELRPLNPTESQQLE